jgi:hypothetical protein
MTMRKGRKARKVLDARSTDYSRMISPGMPHEGKVRQRIESGGYKRPGSNKK